MEYCTISHLEICVVCILINILFHVNILYEVIDMAYKDSSKAIEYVNQYNKKKYDRITVMLPKGEKETVKLHAMAHGEKMNAFIVRAIREAMERDGFGGVEALHLPEVIGGELNLQKIGTTDFELFDNYLKGMKKAED